MSLKQTPSQTVGPFFAYGLTAPQYGYDFTGLASETVADDLVPGERIRIAGRVFDGAGEAIPDAMIEIWQADAQGRYAHPRDDRAPNAAFKGFGRAGTDADGRYSFETIKPGPVPGPNGSAQAPHILVAYFSRGLLTHMYTRIYFSDEPANKNDPILALVPAERRETLIAKKETRGARPVYRFDIRVQGENETVFFDL